MGNYYTNRSKPIGFSPIPASKVPAHGKKRLSSGVVAMISVLAGALVTTGVVFALQPGAPESSVGNVIGTAPQAVAAVAESDAQPKTEHIVLAAEGHYLPVPILAVEAPAKVEKPESERAEEEPVIEEEPVVEEAVAAQALMEVEAEESKQPVWHEGWTETVTTPAVTEHIPGYDSYICSECGYESLDPSDIDSHIAEHANASYLLVENEPIDFVVEEEKTKTIKHEGYWE